MAGYSIRSGSGDEESSEESDEEDEGAVVVGVPSNVDKHGSKISVVPKEAAVPADAVKDDAENEKAPSKKVRRRYIDGDAVLALAKKPFNGQSDIYSSFEAHYTLTNVNRRPEHQKHCPHSTSSCCVSVSANL